MKENSNSGTKLWKAFGGLLAVGLVIMVVKELPAIRREMRIMRM